MAGDDSAALFIAQSHLYGNFSLIAQNATLALQAATQLADKGHPAAQHVGDIHTLAKEVF